MECFEGKEMFEYITNSGSYSEENAKFLFKQLVEGIYFLHQKGIVHRDLKPNNILVSTDGKILKITDFNVAKFCDDYKNYDGFKKNNYEMNTYTGTIAFRAPEMFQNLSYTESIDIWAAGCVLYTMLCGDQPFFSKYLVDLIILIENCDYNFEGQNWKLVSESAKDLIKNLILKDPKLRLSPKDLLKHNWFFETNHPDINQNHKRNNIQTILKKNKRRLTKSNINPSIMKRKSFNQHLRLSKGFDIFPKKLDDGLDDVLDENDSCSNYNINDSYNSSECIDMEESSEINRSRKTSSFKSNTVGSFIVKKHKSISRIEKLEEVKLLVEDNQADNNNGQSNVFIEEFFLMQNKKLNNKDIQNILNDI